MLNTFARRPKTFGMSDAPAEPRGETPVTAEQREGLILGHITTQGELDQAEADNISLALSWLAQRRRIDVLSIDFAKLLHRQMYGAVYRWAGTFSREVNRRIGSDAHDIEPDLRTLLADTRHRLEFLASDSDRLDLLAGFHHRLTKIHPFPNGNGRWSRVLTDLLALRLNVHSINWGGDGRTTLHLVGNESRDRYLTALQAGDGHDLTPLVALLREWTARSS